MLNTNVSYWNAAKTIRMKRIYMQEYIDSQKISSITTIFPILPEVAMANKLQNDF